MSTPLTEKVQARVGLSSVKPSAGLWDPIPSLCVRNGLMPYSYSRGPLTRPFCVLPVSSTAGTHLVLSGRLAILQPDPKCPWGSLLVLLDNVDTPGGFGSCSTVFWDEQWQRELGSAGGAQRVPCPQCHIHTLGHRNFIQ